MDELKRAAALLGKKGGEVKGPKGFARSGKASAAGKKGMVKRWGKRCSITLEFIYSPHDASALIEAALKTYDYTEEPADYTATNALGDLVVEALLDDQTLQPFRIMCVGHSSSDLPMRQRKSA